MLEKLIEDWLTRVNERAFEIPFCQLLNSEGYKIIHISRHGPYEEGKDIISVAPDGVPCAFQLKGGNIALRGWENITNQVTRLVEVPIVHPSIPKGSMHRSYLVTTGQIDEEVRTEIHHRNDRWTKQGNSPLETIVKGELLRRFIDSSVEFWPVELESNRALLEFYLSDGRSCVDKGILANFIGSLLPINGHPSPLNCSRSLSSAALLTSYVLNPFYETQNHVAQIEGWFLFLAYMILLIEKHDLKEKYWRSTFDIVLSAIEIAFEHLYDELKARKNYLEGNGIIDFPFLRPRITWLMSLIAGFELWKQRKDREYEFDSWSRKFILDNRNKLIIWGEAAIPQFLVIIWFLRKSLGTSEPDEILHTLIKAICKFNSPKHENSRGISNPYRGLESVIKENLGLSEELKPELYVGRAYTIETLVHLYTRRNWRQRMRRLWPQITRLDFVEFELEESWQFCLWRCEEHGKLLVKRPKTTQSWAELRNISEELHTSLIPRIFVEYPELLLLFIIVYPHRLTPNVGKFLDNQFGRK